jgi:hypothetical protein
MRPGIAPFAGRGALRPVFLERGGTPFMANGGLVVHGCLALKLPVRTGRRFIGMPREESRTFSDCGKQPAYLVGHQRSRSKSRMRLTPRVSISATSSTPRRHSASVAFGRWAEVLLAGSTRNDHVTPFAPS